MRTKGWITIAMVTVTLTLLVYSCENKSIPIPATNVPSSCDTTGIAYSSGTNTLKTIIDVQCGTNNNTCHSARTAFDFTTYSGIYTYYKNGILYSCLFQGTPYAMPLTPQPGWSDSSVCMKAKFKAWINAGAPQ